MKSLLTIISLFITILLLIFLYTNESTKRKDLEFEADKWKSIAEIEQKVPSINEKAQNFVKALNRGEHHKYLTGDALAEYEDALENNLELEEGHEEEIDTSLQDMKILLTNTESETENEATSTLLYQLNYEGIFDNKGQGIVDQRVMTIIMNVDWIRTKKGFLVNSYEIELLEDTLGLDLSSELKGSEAE